LLDSLLQEKARENGCVVQGRTAVSVVSGQQTRCMCQCYVISAV